MDLEGRVAVITGATGTLGRVVAREFARQGASLALLSSNQTNLDALLAELELPDERRLAHAADLRTGDAARTAADQIAQRFGAIHLLAHLVGGWIGGQELTATSARDLESMLEQHVWTTFHLLKAFVPHITSSGWGRVFVVSSPVAAQPTAKAGPYAVAKAAEEALMLLLAQEVRGSGVTANIIQVRAIDAQHTRPEEIAATMLFLCSAEGGRLNGARLPLVG